MGAGFGLFLLLLVSSSFQANQIGGEKWGDGCPSEPPELMRIYETLDSGRTLELYQFFVAKAVFDDLSSSWAVFDESLPPPISSSPTL